MESPAGTRRAAAGRRRWTVPAVVVLLSVAVAGWLLLPGDEGDAAAPARVSLGSDDASPGSDPITPAAAMIIEEVPVAGDAGLITGSLREADTTAAAGAMVAVPDAGTAPAAPANPFAAAPPTRARPQPVPTRAPSRQPRSGDEPDLLAVLLGNIRSGDSSTAGRDVDGLDALIQSMQASETATAGSAEPARAGRPLRTRSEQIQSNLRECPPPNTPQGLRCRQEICAVYAGRDPACPAG